MFSGDQNFKIYYLSNYLPQEKKIGDFMTSTYNSTSGKLIRKLKTVQPKQSNLTLTVIEFNIYFLIIFFLYQIIIYYFALSLLISAAEL